MQLPAEFRLLLQTARADRAAVNRDRIRSLTGESIDWDLLVRAAERHQLTPLVHRNLQFHASDLVPAEALRQLTIRSLMTSTRNQRFATELARLNDRLLAKDLHVISYKGPTAAAVLYGDLRMRTFGDLDFLVKRADLDAVCDVLRESGYQNRWTGTPEQKELMEREQKEYCFVSGPFSVEPHWSITARRFAFDIDYPALWTRAQELQFNDSALLTFGPEDMLLVLSVCGCKGRWKRLQMISDVAETVRTWPDLDWDACFARAQSSRSARMLKIALHLAHDLLGAPLPDPVIERIREDRHVPGIVQKIVKSLWVPRIENPWTRQGPTIFSPMLFSFREGARDKLQYLLRTTTTPHTLHQKRFPLGESLSWAYYVIVPIHDYILNPAWLALCRLFGRQPANRPFID